MNPPPFRNRWFISDMNILYNLHNINEYFVEEPLLIVIIFFSKYRRLPFSLLLDIAN
jgi:hypothetical protein